MKKWTVLLTKELSFETTIDADTQEEAEELALMEAKDARLGDWYEDFTTVEACWEV